MNSRLRVRAMLVLVVGLVGFVGRVVLEIEPVLVCFVELLLSEGRAEAILYIVLLVRLVAVVLVVAAVFEPVLHENLGAVEIFGHFRDTVLSYFMKAKRGPTC